MDVNEIKKIIISQKESMEYLFKNERIIERDLNIEEAKKYLLHPNILAITGIRRSGKSIFSWLLMENEKFGYINFFDERLNIGVEDLDKIVQAFYELYGEIEFFIFDEIQKIQGWEKFISRLRTSNKIIITGSNSELLKGNLSTYLTGRHIDLEMFPFSFNEYLKLFDIKRDKNNIYSIKFIASIKRLLKDYMENGGFPEVKKFGPVMLQEIYRDIIENDIINQNNIRNKESIRKLVKYVITNTGNEITFNKLKEVVSIKNIHTVINYVTYISDSYLIMILERFSFKLKDQYKAPKKVYCIDTGLFNSISFKFSENNGRIMENIVFLELLRRKNRLKNEIYYWKNYQNKEVDFLIKERDTVNQLIQVTYASSGMEINEREINSLLIASEDLKCNNLLLITWDYEDIINVKNKKIYAIPLLKWLVN